jgi:adenosine deaminase
MRETADSPDDLRALPKVELHRHLEGAVRLSTIIDLAREAGEDLPGWTPRTLAPHVLITEPLSSLEEALERFFLAQRSFRSYEAVRRITREAVEDLDADGIRLAELRFSPDYLCSPAGLDWDGVLEAIRQGVQDTAHLDVTVGLVSIFSRDFGEASAARTVEWTVRNAERFVGFDIAGPELGYPPQRYAELTRPIRASGLGLTAHYGESGPPEYPRAAIETLGVRRLGHGVSVAHDREVTALARDRGVTLEVCPTSNRLTGAVPSLQDHPALRLLQEGVGVCLNTDDPGLFGIDLTHEFQVARDHLGFTRADFRKVTAIALDASFLPDDVKRAVRRRHFAWLDG